PSPNFPALIPANSCFVLKTLHETARDGNAVACRETGFLAEREGFEPPIDLRLCRISSAVHSTTLPPLLDGGPFIYAQQGEDQAVPVNKDPDRSFSAAGAGSGDRSHPVRHGGRPSIEGLFRARFHQHPPREGGRL